jgi:hypothetical protein
VADTVKAATKEKIDTVFPPCVTASLCASLLALFMNVVLRA